MKCLYRIVVVLIATAISVANGWAQQKQHTYFTLKSNITAQDYQQGVMLVKLKPGQQEAFRSGASSRTMTKLQQAIGIRDVQPVVPARSTSKAAQQRTRPAVIDITSMQIIRFDPKVDIEEAINQVYATGVVEYAEPSYIYHTHYTPNDPRIGQQYYHEVIRSYDAWDISKGSEDIVIGIVDSGIDANHPDLENKKAINEDEIPDNGVDDDDDGYIDNVWGWDFIGDDINNNEQDNDPGEDPDDGTSHGTLVAGCAVAEADNETGIAGVGFNARFLITKHSYAGDTANSIYAGYQGIAYMADQEVDIINLSFGGPGGSQFVQDIIDYAVLDQGCLVVASAGNDASDENNFPAAYNHVLSVAATDATDQKASFTNTGYTVDISAPGTRIYTTAIGSAYTSVQGTSFSAPIVAGAAALVKAAYPDMTGLQIGEILRVTADTDLYENAVNPQNQMGKGRLDIVNALTQQLPSIRAQNTQIGNLQEDIPQEGDTIEVTADFVNYLWASTGALTATMTTTSSYVDMLQGQQTLGSIAMQDTVSNADSPFRLAISENTPENTNIDLLITYTDGDYTDYEYITILVNPSYLNVQENLIATSISSRGRIGFQDNTLDDRAEGLGFIFEETNLLFEMGLMLGTSAEKLSDAVRSSSSENPENDFNSLEQIARLEPGLYSYSEIVGSFNDAGADSASSEVTVDFRSLVWVDDPDDQYVIVQYTIHNDGEDSLQNFYAGLYADWDIGAGGGSDRADWDSINTMGYVYSAVEDGRLFAGLQELSGRPNYFAIDNDESISGSPFGVYDGFTNSEKFTSMSEGIGRTQAGFSNEDGNDVSHTVASGPYTIAPGDSTVVAFALHGALSLEELKASAEAASNRYNELFVIPAPEVSDAQVCYGDSTTLEATDGTDYRWYTAASGGALLSDEAVFQTGAITQDTSFYVSNVVDGEESNRVAVAVTLAVDASIQVDGATAICGDQPTTLSVPEADSYLWSNGATTQSITVTEPGAYFVEVNNTSLNCTAVSDTITITQVEAVVANFENDLGEVAVAAMQRVQFTDLSTGDIAEWLWEFGDDSTSTAQSPAHVYADAGAYEVTLTVTSEAGCSSTIVQNLDVITGLEDSLDTNRLKLIPNPARQEVRLYWVGSGNDGTISIDDVKGKRMTTIPVGVAQQQLSINTETLTPGIYLVRYISGTVSYVRRLIINP